jgi:5-methyltetrahydropteroyltriglutamate--homocysteine methyltransferase
LWSPRGDNSAQTGRGPSSGGTLRRHRDAEGNWYPVRTPTDAVRRDQEVFDGVAGITSALHVCRGNNRSRWVGSDPYEAFAGVLFGEIRVDRLLLEYENDRSGGFERLALSTQCGFASDAEGNAITPEAQRDKLALVVDLAGEIWA